MAKTLKDFLNERQLGPMVVKNPDEQKFIDKHVVAKTADRNGNDDEVFKGSKVKMADRPKHRKGYNPGQDEEVYEGLSESTYEFDVSGEHGNAAVDKLVKHANSNGIKAKVHTYDGPGGGNPVIHLSHKDPKVVHSYAKKHIDPDVDLSDHKINEALKGAQHKIDANKNGKVDAHDFHLLRKKKKVAEEAEELEELSRKTLGSYISKATVRKGQHDYEAGKAMGGEDYDDVDDHFDKADKREKGINKAVKKLTKEEAEELDELSTDTLRNYRAKAKADAYDAADVDDDRRLRKRSMGSWDAGKKILKRGDALRKEEAEQIDEILDTPKKAADYKAKAEKSFKDNIWKGGEKAVRTTTKRLYGLSHPKVAEEVEIEEKLDMKKASMGTVVKDFQKSDAPQFIGKSQKKRQAMAVAAKLTAERGGKPLNKEERLLAKLADISETHQRTMVSVFEKLNEDNQYAFMQACDTANGIEQMLDFSISYRGE